MKRSIALILLLSIFLSLAACGAAAPQPETVPETRSQPESVPVQTEPTEPETEPAPTEPPETAPMGVPLLTVASITFCLPGETEDIYCGTAPAEEILWASEDPAVAVIENGVITTVGPGTTSVTAEYNGQILTAQVTCLADSPESLSKVKKDTLRQPRRMPPRVEELDLSFFDDVVFVGDSITFTMQYRSPSTGAIGNPMYLVRGGVSINGFLKALKRITYQGREMELEDAIAKTGAKKVFFMLGQNDLGYRSVEATMVSWAELLRRVREKNPGIEIYIQSLVPEWKGDYDSNEKNEKIDIYNEELKVFCAENDCRYVEVAAYIEDCANKMASVYAQDFKIHINKEGADTWMEVLRAYLKMMQVKGEV